MFSTHLNKVKDWACNRYPRAWVKVGWVKCSGRWQPYDSLTFRIPPGHGVNSDKSIWLLQIC